MSEANIERQPTTPAALRPDRWLVVQASALLEAVASTNYTCYGRAGVPTYPVDRVPREEDAAPTLCAEMIVRSSEDAVRLACLDLDFSLLRQDEWQVAWSSYDAPRQLQILWIWDFYRILSHAILRLRLPRKEQTGDVSEAWQGGIDALRAMQPGDVLEFNVRSACGDIHQRHALAAPAREWEPAGPHAR